MGVGGKWLGAKSGGRKGGRGGGRVKRKRNEEGV